MKNNNEEKIHSISINKNNKNYNEIEFKNIYNNDEFTICSINNGINPIINLLIDSIDRFSFGELLEEEKLNDKILINIPPDNYSSIIHKSNNEKEILIKEKNIIKNIEDIIDYNNNIFTNNENTNNNKKICGIINREDFDIKTKINHSKKLNDSFEKKYINPLENDNLINSNEYNDIGGCNKENNISTNSNINKYNGSNKCKDDDLKLNQNIINNKMDKEINLDNLIIFNSDENKNNNQNIINNNNSSINNDIFEEPKIKTEDVYCRDSSNIDMDILNKEKEKINLDINSNLDENEKDKKIIINPITSKKDEDIDIKEKLLELSEKVERSEKNIKIIKNVNEKLLEIIKNFKINENNENNINIKSEENRIQNNTVNTKIKRRCYSPSLNNVKININKNYKEKINKDNPNIKHKKSKSFSKLKVFVDSNNLGKKNNDSFYYKKIKEYCLSKGNITYSEMYNKDRGGKKKLLNNKLYKYDKNKSDRSHLKRRTIFITGNSNNNYNKVNNYNINNNMFTNIYKDIDNHEEMNGNYLYNHSFPSSRINHNNSEILITNGLGNIYQREIMKLPLEQQPLFYESNNNKFFINNNHIYDNKIFNNQCNDTISFNDQKLNFDEKYNYKKIKINNYNKLSESNKNGIYHLNNSNYIENKSNGNSHVKNKLLDFKDFQVIFEEKNDNDNDSDYINKTTIKTDENNINQIYTINNSYRNKFLGKNIIGKKNNQKLIPSLKNKINNNIKININKKVYINNNKENGNNIFKKENIVKENGNPKVNKNKNINKYSEYINKKYKNLFGNKNICNTNEINNGKIINNHFNNKKNQFMIPFYLINKQDLYLNILNTSNTKKKLFI